MSLWLILVGVFLLQEVVSTNAALLAAYTGGYNVWIIHLLFLGVTIFDTAIGYGLGVWVQQRFGEKWWILRAEAFAHRIELFTGRIGRRLTLVLLGIVGFPYLNGFLASILPISFWESLFLVCLGSLIWYVAEWTIVLSIHTLVPDPFFALGVLIACSIVIIIILRYVTQRTIGRL